MAIFQINKVLEKDYIFRLVRYKVIIILISSLFPLIFTIVTSINAYKNGQIHIFRTYLGMTVFLFIFTSLWIFYAIFDSKLLTKSMRIELKENSIRQFLDISNATWFEKATLKNSILFDIEIPFLKITSILSKRKDTLIMTNDTDYFKTRNFIVIPIETEQSDKILEIIQQYPC